MYIIFGSGSIGLKIRGVRSLNQIFTNDISDIPIDDSNIVDRFSLLGTNSFKMRGVITGLPFELSG
jgi:hypothetical protein